MVRLARLKLDDQDAWYHIHSRVAGVRGEYPLEDPAAQRKLIEMLQHFSRVYFCDVASFCVMGNHYHVVARFSKPGQVERKELEQRARLLYPSEVSRRVIAHWSEERWERFRQRLFDVSEFMRNLQAAYARWYNRVNDRRGRFWADRFKSVCLQQGNAVLDCMLYVDLNPIRAGLVERPEEWRGSSVYLREMNKDEWLLPLPEVCEERSPKKALVEYRALLYLRGNIPTKEGQAFIPDWILAQEEARGFKVRGIYRKRLGYFVDGLAVGTDQFIRSHLATMREVGLYKRRKNPIAQLDGVHYSLREQRSTAVVF